MYLKRLEISGFKSFADRTRLELSPGINTVVGPNGCGKSNIIDAVRWVLGEQKYSVLRSKGMEEVIFVGTGKRKPGGLAYVTLTFDNSDGDLPVEASEVAVTRRAFREGSGQYLINNKNVRLKDIQEMVADTGLGSGALFVLSNQEIDRVLSPNAQERRSILEETAGVNRYQMRKKETLRKLESTRENMARLNDILQEVGRQVEFSLKQLQKLNRYKNVKERLQRLEFHRISLEMDKLNEERKNLETSFEEIEGRKKQVLKEIESVNFNIGAMESQRREILKEIERENEEFSRVSVQEQKLTGTGDLVEEKIRQAEGAIREYNEDLKRIEGRRLEVEERLGESRRLVEDLEKKKKDLEARLAAIEEEYRSREEAYKKVCALVEERDKRKSDLTQKLSLVNLKIDHCTKNLESLKREKEAHGRRVGEMQSQIASTGEKLTQWQIKLSELTEKKEIAQKKLSATDLKRGETQGKVENISLEIREFRERTREAQSELSLLIREEENYRGFSSAFAALMKQKNELPPLVPIHTIIKVEAEYEVAAEIILGGHFQSIITENKRDADRCIDFLKRERLGRLTFFPMDLPRNSSDLPNLPRSLPGIVGWARDLIKTEPVYRDIIEQICGRTLVVKDLDCAYNIYEKQKGSRDGVPRMVTLDGELLERTGAVTGGRYHTERSALLSRARRRDDLEASTKRGLKEIETRQALLQNLKDEYQVLEGEYKGSLAAFERQEREEREILGQVKVLESLLEQGKKDFDRLESGGEEFEGKIEAENLNVESLRSESINIQTDINTMEQSGKLGEQENIALIQDVQEAQVRRDQVRRMIEEAESDLRFRKSKERSDLEYLEENKKDLERIHESIQQKNKNIQDLKGEYQDCLNEGSVLKLKVKSLKIALDTSHEKLAKIEESLEELKTNLTEWEKSKTREEEALNRRHIERIEMDSRRNYLKERQKEFPAEIAKQSKIDIQDIDEITQLVEKNRQKLSSFEGVNFSAQEEYDGYKERFDYLKGQMDDLDEACRSLRNIIKEMDSASLKALEETIELLDVRFGDLFKKIFGGGKAKVFFTDPENKLESGVEIEVQPPGKRTSNIGLLSTGEKSLTAVTFLFALLSIKPGPFVLLDELDAPLDDSNVEKIANLVKEFSQKSQFIMVTHNRKTMEFADTLVGITMEEPGVSKIVSVKFEDVEKFTSDSVETVSVPIS